MPHRNKQRLDRSPNIAVMAELCQPNPKVEGIGPPTGLDSPIALTYVQLRIVQKT
jgi:hypothetical protein